MKRVQKSLRNCLQINWELEFNESLSDLELSACEWQFSQKRKYVPVYILHSLR